MEQLQVEKYTAESKTDWDTFVKKAKNASFLFQRDFMDYHSHRFVDYSLMVYHSQKLVAVLPANIVDDILHSHQGLSYGGLVLGKRTSFEMTVDIFRSILKYLSSNRIQTLNLKPIPRIYHLLPADEMDYFLFRLNARLYRRDFTSAICYANSLEIKASNRIRGIKKGIKNNLVIKEESNFSAFWKDVLVPNLQQTHDQKPVHSLEEISLLQERFPSHVVQFNVYKDEEIVGGATIFETATVAHAQYISANTEGRKLGSLDLLFDFLINHYRHKRYFDFGISNEDQGRKVNQGLLHWKETFGGRAISHDFYQVETANHILLNDIFL